MCHTCVWQAAKWKLATYVTFYIIKYLRYAYLFANHDLELAVCFTQSIALLLKQSKHNTAQRYVQVEQMINLNTRENYIGTRKDLEGTGVYQYAVSVTFNLREIYCKGHEGKY